MRSRLVAALVVLAFAVLGMWASDFITLQGERTVYTASCVNGQWDGSLCTGELRAGERYRFRALAAHGEVLFWTSGSSAPSGKFTRCQITNGRNWRCTADGSESATITLQMSDGRPVPQPQSGTVPFHQVSKLRWYLLHWGVPAGSSAQSPGASAT